MYMCGTQRNIVRVIEVKLKRFDLTSPSSLHPNHLLNLYELLSASLMKPSD